MRRIPLNQVKDDLSRYLRLAEKEDIIITRHGKPAGYLVGFENEDDWIDYLLINDPAFQARMQRSLQEARTGNVVSIEALRQQMGLAVNGKSASPTRPARKTRRASKRRHVSRRQTKAARPNHHNN